VVEKLALTRLLVPGIAKSTICSTYLLCIYHTYRLTTICTTFNSVSSLLVLVEGPAVLLEHPALYQCHPAIFTVLLQWNLFCILLERPAVYLQF